MEINPQEFAQKLSEKYQLQCLQFFQEIISLQVQIELRDEKIQELEAKLTELEVVDELPKLEDNEEINVNSTSNT